MIWMQIYTYAKIEIILEKSHQNTNKGEKTNLNFILENNEK